MLNDGVYVGSNYISGAIETKNYKDILKTIEIFDIEEDIYKLENVLRNTISNYIRNDRYNIKEE